MKFEFKKSLRGLSDEELLEELKSCANQLGQDTITMNQFEKHGKGHPTTFCRRFGSWPKALELANLKPSRSEINISDEKLFINLQIFGSPSSDNQHTQKLGNHCPSILLEHMKTGLVLGVMHSSNLSNGQS